jgi:hypothetical protein
MLGQEMFKEFFLRHRFLNVRKLLVFLLNFYVSRPYRRTKTVHLYYNGTR